MENRSRPCPCPPTIGTHLRDARSQLRSAASDETRAHLVIWDRLLISSASDKETMPIKTS